MNEMPARSAAINFAALCRESRLTEIRETHLMAGWGGKANGRRPRPPAAMPWTYCLSSPLISRGLSHPFRAPSPEQSCRQAFIRAGATPWHTMLNALVTERNGTGWTQSIKRHFKPYGATCQPASKSCLHFGQVVRRVSVLCQFFFFLLWLCAAEKSPVPSSRPKSGTLGDDIELDVFP